MNYLRLRILINSVILVALVGPLNAERVGTINASVDLVAAVDSNPQLDSTGSVIGPPQGAVFLTYGVYPSITLNSTGPNSNLRLSYAFGFNRVDSETLPDSESHTFGGEVDAQLTRNLRFRILESFTRTADLRTLNLFRGILVTPEGVFFDYETVAVSQKSYWNNATIGLDYAVDSNSSLSFGFGHSLRRFQENLPSLTNLSDQDILNGSLRYTQAIGPRTSWDLGYSVFHYDFQVFENARTHLVNIGFSHQFSPSVSLRLGVGPSYTEARDQQSSFFSPRNGSLTLSKSFDDNLLSFSYSRQSGTSTGVGGLSDVETLRLDFSRPIGRRTSVSANVTLYGTEARLDNPVENRGLSASLLFNFLLHDSWVLVLGGSYQNDEENRQSTGTFDFERKRIFLSLRFTLPELLRF